MTTSNLTTSAAWFISKELSTVGAVAVCHRPDQAGPPVVAAMASDRAAAWRIVSDSVEARRAAAAIAARRAAEAERDGAAGRVAEAEAMAAEAVARQQTALASVADLQSEIARLSAEIAAMKCNVPTIARSGDAAPPVRRARASGPVQPDYRTAAEVWLSGEILKRPQRAAYRKSQRAASVRVLFEDGIEIRTSTYLDGQAGLNAAAQFARTTRQGKPEAEDSQVARLRRRASGSPEPVSRAEWIHDTRGCWRLVEIAPCPAVLTVEYAED